MSFLTSLENRYLEHIDSIEKKVIVQLCFASLGGYAKFEKTYNFVIRLFAEEEKEANCFFNSSVKSVFERLEKMENTIEKIKKSNLEWKEKTDTISIKITPEEVLEFTGDRILQFVYSSISFIHFPNILKEIYELYMSTIDRQSIDGAFLRMFKSHALSDLEDEGDYLQFLFIAYKDDCRYNFDECQALIQLIKKHK